MRGKWLAVVLVALAAPGAAHAAWPVDFSPVQEVGPSVASGFVGPVAIADVTGDGKPDLVEAGDGPKVLVYPQDAGRLDAPQTLDLSGLGPNHTTPDAMATGQLSLGGGVEIALATSAGIVVLYPSTGVTHLMPGTGPAYGVAIADVDGDGLPDVVGGTDYGLEIFHNTGTGWTSKTISPEAYGYVNVADFNGDGRADIIACPSWGNGCAKPVQRFTQNADGSFTQTRFTFGGSYLVVGDFNGDGRTDVAIANAMNVPGASVWVFLQQSDGTLAPATVYGTYDVPETMVAADVNGDGRTDLVVAHNGWDEVGVLQQTSSGTFAREQLFYSSTEFAAGIPLGGLAVGDLDGDGKPDIAVVNGSLNVLRQNGTGAADTRLAATTITSGPQGVVSSSTTTASFSFASNGANPLYQCALDDQSATVCPGNPATYSSLAPGLHQLFVRTSDSSNYGPEPFFEIRSWYVGAPNLIAPAPVLPDTTITSGPPSPTASTSATFAFGGTGPVVYFQCELDQNPAANSIWSFCPNGPELHTSTYSNLAPGTHTLYIRATDGDFNADRTPASFTWTITGSAPPPPPAAPANDNFASAQALTYDTMDGGLTTTNATKETGEPNHAGNPGGHSIWFSITFQSTGTLEFDTQGTSWDTLLAAYTGSSVASLTQVAANDDVSSTDHTSQITLAVASGVTYHIAVDGKDGASGTGAFDMKFTPSSAINLPNASFESGLTGWASWNGTLSLATDAHDGANAAKVTASGGATSYSIYPTTHPATNITAGTAYTASAWVRSDDPGHKICIYIREYSSSNTVVALVSSCLTATTTGWQQIPAVNYTTQQSGGSLQIFVQPNGGTSFEADAFSLALGTSSSPPPPPAPPPSDVVNLANPSFESGLTGWASWNGTLSLATDGHDGSNAAKVTANAGVSGYSIYPTSHPATNITAGTAYTGSAWVRSDDPGHKICIYIREYSSSNTVVALVSSCLTSTTSWQQIPALHYTTQQSGGSLQVFVQPGGGTSFEADAFSLTKP